MSSKAIQAAAPCQHHGCEQRTNGTHHWMQHKPSCPKFKGKRRG